jgi:hypothetical protein
MKMISITTVNGLKPERAAHTHSACLACRGLATKLSRTGWRGPHGTSRPASEAPAGAQRWPMMTARPRVARAHAGVASAPSSHMERWPWHDYHWVKVARHMRRSSR